jgi:DNA-binding FadR family transcriptional regulator
MSSDGDGVAARERLHVPKTSEILADRLRAQIIRGELCEGDALPPEGQLMETLGLSRPTLREAFRILEAEGLISVTRGSRTGAKVHRPSVRAVSRYAGYVLQSQGTTIKDLYQAREAIEPTVVEWLAAAEGEERTVELRRVVGKLAMLLDQGRCDEFLESIDAFHEALIRASGSKTLAFVNGILLNLTRRHQKDYVGRNSRMPAARVKDLRVGLASLEKLISLIDARDVEAAGAHWRLHLSKANAGWARSGEAERVVDSLGR